MGIQKCESCGNQFRWKEIIRQESGLGFKPLACGRCGLEHHITLQTKLIPGLVFAVFIFFSFFISNVPYAMRLSLFGLFLLLSILNLLIFPYYAKYKAVKNQK
ncbi:hypothetical protein E2K98_12850 [Bacillus salipaludis]|uniref:CXXC-20-CXXC protein n=1 Tax=Bacillus salipaludis TaxID=2547811 RepID=A0A4R5VUL7_9BACI|nr:TIGR04104 family putative zinc finger protein [Bacillus salipaludis]TDK61772.1 hypothetical protein E2K98_12850 [Bacillus salipaludis]